MTFNKCTVKGKSYGDILDEHQGGLEEVKIPATFLAFCNCLLQLLQLLLLGEHSIAVVEDLLLLRRRG
jgi:hypothetical protein